jgi:hypothetical protein
MRATIMTLLLATACGGGNDYVETEETRQRTGREQRTQFVGLDVRLMEPGEEPREALRYRIEEGDRETAVLGLRMGVTRGLGDPQQIEGGEPVYFTVESGPVEHVGERVRFEVELLRSELGSHPEHVESEVAAVHQIDGYVVVDDRGITRDEHFDIPGGIPPRTATMLGNIFDSLELIPLPEEPIGIGATWEVRETIDVSTYTMQQVVVYKLLAREGDDMRLELVVTQTAEPQPLRDLPGGAEAMIELYEGDGRGAAQVSLTRLVPHTELDINSQLEARADGGQVLAMTTRTQVLIAPSDADPPSDDPEEPEAAK